MTTPLFWLVTAFVFAFGACVGSFLNVVVWRLPRGESLISPPSHCPKCNHPLRAWDNIPIIAWLTLRGRCRYCEAPISVRYPLVETATAVLYSLVWWRVVAANLSLNTAFAYAFLAAALVAVTLIDLDCLIIPDEITFTGLALALLIALVDPHAVWMADATGAATTGPVLLGTAVQDLVGGLVPGELTGRFATIVNAGAGGILAGGVLWLFLALGNIVWGTLRGQDATGRPLRVTSEGFRIDDVLEDVWQNVPARASRPFKVKLDSVDDFTLKDETRSVCALPALPAELLIHDGNLTAGDVEVPLTDVSNLEGDVVEWQIPREAMGLGDVKLFAMIGALLGPDPALFILLFGAVTGCLVGAGRALFQPSRRHRPIPFGPFLAAGTFMWMFFGPELFHWYSDLLLHLSSTTSSV